MKTIRLLILLVVASAGIARAQATATAKPVPRLQIIPQADDQAAFVRDDTESHVTISAPPFAARTSSRSLVRPAAV